MKCVRWWSVYECISGCKNFKVVRDFNRRVGKSVKVDDRTLHTCWIFTYCTLRGRIKGAASAVSVIQHGLRGSVCYTAWHVITVIVLAFLTQVNKAGKMQSTINQLKHGKGRAVRCNNDTRGGLDRPYSTRLCLVLYGYLDHTPRTIIARTALPSVL